MRRNVFGGLFFILVGTILILNNLGYLGWGIWLSFLTFWPLILVAVGLKLVFRNNLLVQVLAVLMVIGIPVAYHFGYTGPLTIHRTPFSGVNDTFNWSLEKDTKIQEVRLELNIGSGKVRVEPSGKLIEVRANGVSQPKVEAQGSSSSNKKQIIIEQAKHRIPPMGPGRNGREDWQLFLGRDVVWDLQLATGAVAADLDFSQLSLRNLDVDTGAGDLRIVLGDMKIQTEVKVDSGAGNVTFVIPDQVGVRAQLDTGIGSKDMAGRQWRQDGNVYTSENYEQAESKINIDLDAGVGGISIVKP